MSFRYAGTTAAGMRDGYIVTNLGAALGLEGQTLKVQVGQFEADNFNVSTVTGLELEDVADGWGTRDGNIQMDYAYGDMFKLRGVVGPGMGDAMDGMVAVAVMAGPAEVELFYSDDGATPITEADRPTGEGVFGVGAAFSQEVVPGTVDLSVGVDFAMDLAKDEELNTYGFGVSAGLMGGMATVGAGFGGVFGGDLEEDSFLNAAGLDLNVAPVAFAGFDLAVVLGLDGDVYDDTLQYLEASAYLKPGKATYRVGYASYPEGVESDIYTDYKAMGYLGDAESTGFMFFNASLSY
jgi:hypothetical protein